jgi:hypothetical protein
MSLFIVILASALHANGFAAQWLTPRNFQVALPRKCLRHENGFATQFLFNLQLHAGGVLRGVSHIACR